MISLKKCYYVQKACRILILVKLRIILVFGFISIVKYLAYTVLVENTFVIAHNSVSITIAETSRRQELNKLVTSHSKPREE